MKKFFLRFSSVFCVILIVGLCAFPVLADSVQGRDDIVYNPYPMNIDVYLTSTEMYTINLDSLYFDADSTDIGYSGSGFIAPFQWFLYLNPTYGEFVANFRAEMNGIGLRYRMQDIFLDGVDFPTATIYKPNGTLSYTITYYYFRSDFSKLVSQTWRGQAPTTGPGEQPVLPASFVTEIRNLGVPIWITEYEAVTSSGSFSLDRVDLYYCYDSAYDYRTSGLDAFIGSLNDGYSNIIDSLEFKDKVDNSLGIADGYLGDISGADVIPDVNAVNPDVSGYVSPASVALVAGPLSIFYDVPIVFTMLLLVAILAFGAYVLFGER